MKALIAALAPAAGLVATYVRDSLEPYRPWVWIAFAVLPVLALIYEFIAARAHKAEPPPTQSIDRSISVGGSANGSILNTGDGSSQIRAEHIGEWVQGDKVTNVYQPPSSDAPLTMLHQLPAPPRDFTGRKDELDDLFEKANSGGVAICGLRGEGGVGKTALALDLAARLASDYPDAQLYLDLKGVSPQPMAPQDAMAHVIRAWHPTASLPQDDAQLSAMYR